MAYFNLLRIMFGAGILGLPLAVSQAGIILGPIMSMALGLLLLHMHLTLLWCLREISRQLKISHISYRYAFRLALLHGPSCFRIIGERGPAIIATFMIMSQLGICTVFVIFTTDSLRDIMDWDTSRPAMAALLVPYLLLEHFMKTLKIVSYISMTGNLMNLVGVIIVTYHIFLPPYGRHVLIFATTDALALYFVIGTCLFNLSSVGVVLSLDRALPKPKVLTQFCGVISISMFTTTVILTIFGGLGYWAFGTMEENVLRFLPFDDKSALFAIGLYLIAIAFAYPIQCYPAIRIIIEIIKSKSIYETPSEKTLQMVEMIARPVFVLISFLICYLIPIQGAFVAFVGNLCTTMIALVFPALMELCILYPHDYGLCNFYLIKDLIIIFFGLSSFILGVALCGYLIYDRQEKVSNTKTRVVRSVHSPRDTRRVFGFDADYSKDLPLWTWSCIHKKCVPQKSTSTGKLQSLITCNMLCGSMLFWPYPTGDVSVSTTSVAVRADLFYLQVMSFPSVAVRDYLNEAFELFRDDLRVLEKKKSYLKIKHTVTIRVTINEDGSEDPRLRLDTDESYKLRLQRTNGTSVIVDIFANSFCGSRHALETLSQMVWFDPYEKSLFIIESASVDDSPRFKYRGLMLDTARNFFPSYEIIRTLDAMAASKLNTFHWHATDSHALSVHLNGMPETVEHDEYEPDQTYKLSDIRAIVRHAKLRGIRILLEVDVPAQVGSSGVWGTYISNKDIQSIYADIIQLTQVDDIFHLGGDIILEQCSAALFNESKSFNLRSKYTQNALQQLENVNGVLPNLTILWSTHISERIKIDLNVFIDRLGFQARNVRWSEIYISGMRTIISHEDAWDFNSGYGTWQEETGGAPYNSWQRVYEHRPWSRGGTINCIEGGEATVWSSTLSAGGLDTRIWPRGAALAERLWSDRAEGATQLVHSRLGVHQIRYINRGIEPTPFKSMWCTYNTIPC